MRMGTTLKTRGKYKPIHDFRGKRKGFWKKPKGAYTRPLVEGYEGVGGYGRVFLPAMAKSGRLDAIKEGRRWRMPPEEEAALREVRAALSTEEVATQLGVSWPTIYNLVSAGRLPHHRSFSGEFRIPKAKLSVVKRELKRSEKMQAQGRKKGQKTRARQMKQSRADFSRDHIYIGDAKRTGVEDKFFLRNLMAEGVIRRVDKGRRVYLPQEHLQIAQGRWQQEMANRRMAAELRAAETAKRAAKRAEAAQKAAADKLMRPAPRAQPVTQAEAEMSAAMQREDAKAFNAAAAKAEASRAAVPSQQKIEDGQANATRPAVAARKERTVKSWYAEMEAELAAVPKGSQRYADLLLISEAGFKKFGASPDWARILRERLAGKQ